MVESRFILRSGIGLEFSGKSEVLPGELTKEDIYSYFEVANLLYIYQREPQGVEKRVDFAAIEKLYAEDAVGVDAKVRAALRRARDEMLKQVEAAARDGRISPLYAATLKIETGAVVKILQEHLVSVWRKSRDLAMRELPGKVKEKLEPLKAYSDDWIKFALEYGHKFSSTQIDLPQAIQKKMRAWVKANVKPEDLSPDEDVGDAFHVTIKYGLHTEDAAPVQKVLSNWGPVSLTLRDIELFDNAPNYDVLIVRVESPDLIDMNQAISKLPHTDTHPTYQPHATLAYLKKGLSDKWVGSADFNGETFTEKMIRFTSSSGANSDISLGDKKTESSFHDESHFYATGFSPQLALDYFASRALVLKGIIDDALLNASKLRLMEYLKGGQTLNEMIGNLRFVFEPWVGDPTKIQPSGQTGIGFPPGTKEPENILMAYRLENIIRTETTTALSQGRRAVGDAVGDYLIGYQLSAILDERTTEICRAADGLMFRKEDAAAGKLAPPLHFQCRTVEVFITTDDVPVEWSEQSEIDEVVQLIPTGFK